MRAASRSAWIGLIVLVTAGCASVPRDPAALAEFKANNDPLEPMNRHIFAFNQSVDQAVIKPIAKGYRWIFPQGVRDALRHFLDNLKEPLVFGNCILQGRLKAAATAGGRFVVNSTVGLAGFTDVASGWKLPRQVGDFGQTLWAWGVPEGPYLVVPVFGPDSPRDGVGDAVDTFCDPLRYIPAHQHYPSSLMGGRVILDGIDLRSRNIDVLEVLQRESIDYYAAFRSLYRQNRAAELRGNVPSTTLPPANFYEDTGP